MNCFSMNSSLDILLILKNFANYIRWAD
jgi:hypothetical protein